MITISGVNVTRTGGEAPTLYDIGYSLSKQPRFGGHTTGHWTVLHHVYACAFYAEPRGPRVQLYALLHDAHESCTSDIPQPWKTEDQRALQKVLDVRIYRSLKLSIPDSQTERIVNQIDNQMVYSEAKRFAPQVVEAILTPGENFRDGISRTDDWAQVAIDKALDRVGSLSPNECGDNYVAFYESLAEARV